MTDRRIITPMLKYWGLEENPFEEVIIRKENKELFIGREEELWMIENSLTNRLTGIYGNYGVGKSSLLWKLIIENEKQSLPSIYVPAGLSSQTIFREILGALLLNIIYNKIKLSKKSKLDPEMEFDRIEGAISSTWKYQYGSGTVLIAQKEDSDSKTKNPHTEETAFNLICNILENATSPVVILIDNLERLRFSSGSTKDYIHFIIGLASSINESFNFQGVAFIISLDERFKEFYDKFNNAAQSPPSLSFGRLINIKNFLPDDLAKLIKQRLKCSGYQKSIADFISLDAFWFLYSSAYGHARRSIKILHAAMEYVASKKRKRIIDLESIKNGIVILGEQIDDKNVAIVEYLRKNGSGSSSDEKFQKTVNLKRAQLAARLKSLTSQINLSVESLTTGNTTKDIYKLPETNLNF